MGSSFALAKESVDILKTHKIHKKPLLSICQRFVYHFEQKQVVIL